MNDQDINLSIVERGIDPQSLNLLIVHGRRQGYISESEIVDCIPEAEFDEELREALAQALADAGVLITDDTVEERESETFAAGELEAEETSSYLADVDQEDLREIEPGDMVRLYVREAARVPLLTAEEEVALAQRIERCRLAQEELAQSRLDDERAEELKRFIEDGRNARDHLIRANARLVISVAKKYLNRGLPFLDLIQEGNIGLMRAIRNYDYHKGFKFSTYATWWIRQAITRALADQGRTIRLPVHLSDQVFRMRREQNRLAQELGRAPSVEELASALEVSPAKVEQMLAVMRSPLSLQMTVGEDEDEDLGDIIEDREASDPEESAAQAIMSEEMLRLVENLPERERQVIEMRFGLQGDEPLTLTEVGRRLGITRERARQLEAQAINRLRHPDRPRRSRS